MQRTIKGIWLTVLAGSLAAGCARDSSSPTEPTISADREIDGNHENEGNEGGNRPFTYAVIGDMPYGPVKLVEFPSLVSLINEDQAVSLVLHAGDIKAGKNDECSDQYFDLIKGLFSHFSDPLVYTPGDNEWTDCHVAIKNNGLYTPTERLIAVRARFFPVAGRTLGIHKRSVVSQAFDPGPSSAYIENVSWNQSGVVFAALNITGSNNDLADWGTPLPANAGNYPSQAQESAARGTANHLWLEQAFARAGKEHASAVVLLFQADMWDTAEPTLAGYDALVLQIGALAARFGKPVLLLEGDSHVFRVDNPFSVSSPLYPIHPATPVADNVTRIVLEGSDKGRTEYLRLTFDPKPKNGVSPFSWVRVPLN